MKIQILPKNHHIREILNYHGDVMELIQDKNNRFLCRSLRRTRSDGDYWIGWFNKIEAIYEPIDEPNPKKGA